MLGLLAEPGCPLAAPSRAARSLHRSSSPSPGSRSPGSVTLRVWELPRPGIEPVSPALTGRFLSTESLGKSSCSLLKVWLEHIRTSLIAQLVKNLPARQETPVRFLSRDNPLEEGKAAPRPQYSWASLVAQLGKNPPTPGLGRSPGGGKGCPPQYSGPGEFRGLHSP